MRLKHLWFAAAVTAVSAAAMCNASAQSVSGSQGDGGTPRSLEAVPDLSARKVVDRTPKVDEGQQRSLREPTLEELQRGFTTISRKKGGGEETVAPDATLQENIKLQQDGNRPERAARPTGEDPLFAESDRTVIGEDSRVQINSTTDYPFRTIGQLWSVDNAGNWSTCTATLISPRAVITAAHCVYSPEAGGWLKDYEFYPAANGNDAPFGMVSWSDVFIMNGYIENAQTSNTPWDMAVIVLSQPVGDNLGWMGYSVYDPAQSFQANIVGYPGDKPASTLWRASCDVFDINVIETNFFYDCDTFGGMSGSSIYDYNPDTKERTINGVHVAGNEEFNIGTRLNWAYFQWVSQNAPR
ncbi:MAG: serine protease [Mesorhizobium sp.]|nr:serine protease [Mesorhizobium sp.]MBL8577031.1 serine protease [Mesorhizobium sp.]